MIDYTLLGPVTARDNGRALDLPPQHQLLLARLVIAAGKPVPREDLTGMLWEKNRSGPPNGGLKRVTHELRTQLRTDPDVDPIPSRGDTYCLPLKEQQADVLRFRAKTKTAYAASGARAAQLMHEAIQEWGADATGLFGQKALDGLPGNWAHGMQTALCIEYRNARLECLKRDLEDRHYETVAWECRRLADDPDAICNEKFVEYWMVAAYRLGERLEALEVYKRARTAVRARLGVGLSGRLQQLAEIIRVEDQHRLPGPSSLLDWSEPPASRRHSEKESPVDKEKFEINFNNHAGSRIEEQIGYVHTLNKQPATNEPDEPDQPDAGEGDHDGNTGREST